MSWTEDNREFYGLNSEVAALYRQNRGVSELFDWQNACLSTQVVYLYCIWMHCMFSICVSTAVQLDCSCTAQILRLLSRRPTCCTRCPPAVARPWWQRFWCCRSVPYSKFDRSWLWLQELTCYKKNVIFVLPFVSIVQEKVRSLTHFASKLGFNLQVLKNIVASCPFSHTI